jgi:hypothetical protein
VKIKRIFRLHNTVYTNAGVQAEFLSKTHEGLAVHLDWGTGGDTLTKLLADDEEIMVTFSRVPKVTGTCEVIKGEK